MSESTEIAKRCAAKINHIAEQNEDRLANGVLAKIIQSAINESLAQFETEHDEEIGEFQNQVRDLLMKLSPGCNPDGAGCDSGDWRDFTLSEIGQGIGFLMDQRVNDVKLAFESLKEAQFMIETMLSIGIFTMPQVPEHGSPAELIQRALATETAKKYLPKVGAQHSC